MSERHIKEKSLLEIWSKALPKIPKNRFNTWASISGSTVASIPLIFGPISGFISLFRPYTDLLAAVYAGLLGFIIAGYAIFTTAGNPKFLLEIWKHIDERSGLPLLKLHLLVFIKLFITVFVSLILVLLQSMLFRLWPVILKQIQISEWFRIFLQVSSLGIIGWTITASAVQLKTLIFNLYDLTLTQVQFLEIEETSSNSKSS